MGPLQHTLAVMQSQGKTKAELRIWARRRRAAQERERSAAEAAALARRCAGRLTAAAGWVLGGYLPLPGELSPVAVMRRWHAAGRWLAVPAWNPVLRRYGFCRWAPGMPLRPGPLRVPEPVRPDWISPCQLDLVLVPGLVFDRHGGRLGFGAGHYDRLLARCRPGARFWGIAFDWQVVGQVPQDPGDIRMHALATPRWFRPVRPE